MLTDRFIPKRIKYDHKAKKRQKIRLKDQKTQKSMNQNLDHKFKIILLGLN